MMTWQTKLGVAVALLYRVVMFVMMIGIVTNMNRIHKHTHGINEQMGIVAESVVDLPECQ